MFTTLIVFILILGLLVLVHEFGHFVTARKFGMKVHEFGFGFPPRAFGVYKDPETGKFVWIWGKGKSSFQKTVSGNENEEELSFPATVYSINWLPLGGFVRIKGENGEKAEESDSFGYQKAWQRIVVLFCGVFMNFILAGVILGIGFMIGLPGNISVGLDDGAIVLQEPEIMVQMVDKESPAEEAGIKYGDKILQLDGVDMASIAQIQEYVAQNYDKEIGVKILRVNEEMELAMTPKLISETEESQRLGVALAEVGIIGYPWYLAIYKGFVAAWYGLVNIFIAFYLLLKNLIFGQGMAFEVAGPVGIAKMVGDSARMGISYLINVTAMISLSLAAINILPIPALDGGRILFILIEKVSGRKVSMKHEQLAHLIGFALLMILIVVVTFRDVAGFLK